jgi:hypothetical protein
MSHWGGHARYPPQSILAAGLALRREHHFSWALAGKARRGTVLGFEKFNDSVEGGSHPMRKGAPNDRCPFAQPGPPLSATGEGFYCRLPGGRVHIPSAEEIRRFCATHRYVDCPVNQRWTPARTVEPT